jgi:lipopolysaccharide export LptBFGC system permease protein LptF
MSAAAPSLVDQPLSGHSNRRTHARVPTPSFIAYIWKFALPILLPVFALVPVSFFSRQRKRR